MFVCTIIEAFLENRLVILPKDKNTFLNEHFLRQFSSAISSFLGQIKISTNTMKTKKIIGYQSNLKILANK